MSNYDVIIIGAGYAGSVMAEQYARDGKRVLILEKKSHIGGNAYDYMDMNHIRIHEYGPHLFHTNFKEVVDYLSQFTEWYPYEHRVKGLINDKFVPIPFNLTSIEELFDEDKANELKEELVKEYGMEKKVPILELRKSTNKEVKDLAEFIFEKVFKYYTMKQWDYTIEELSTTVTDRVPVFVSYDDRYFQDTYQCMPKEGFTRMFEKMLASSNIEVRLNTEALNVMKFDFKNHKIFFEGEEFKGKVIYTGLADYLCGYKYGKLEYRSLWFDQKEYEGTYQTAVTCNYPTPKEIHPFTRITEYKLMMEDKENPRTTIHVEYPYRYDENAEKGNIPYYTVFTEENKARYEKYVEELKVFSNLILLGRLAEFKYYNMDAIVLAALDKYNELKKD